MKSWSHLWKKSLSQNVLFLGNDVAESYTPKLENYNKNKKIWIRAITEKEVYSEPCQIS